MRDGSEKMKNRHYISYMVFGVYILVILMISAVTSTVDAGFSTGDIMPLNEEWQLVEGLKSPMAVSLPAQPFTPVGESVRIGRALPVDFDNEQTLRIRSSMETVKVYLDGAQIYQSTQGLSDSAPFDAEASMWVFVDIPAGSDGSYLEIEVISDIQLLSGSLNEIWYGSKGDLVLDLILERKVSVLIVLFVIGVALMSFVVSLVVRLPDMERLNYLSIFTFAIGLWLLSEIDIFQIVSNNSYVVGSISYLMLPVAVITYVLFIKEAALHKYSRFLNVTAGLSGLYILVSILLQFFLDMHYIESWPVFLLTLAFTVISVVVLLAKDSFGGDRVAGKYLMMVIVLMVTALVEVMIFFIGNVNDISGFSRIGIALFLLMLAADTLNYLGKMIQKEGENRYLRRIAYVDALTGAGNRASFDKEVDRLLDGKGQKPFRLIMFDLNDLKGINDNMGHEFGDSALKSMYEGIADIFGGDWCFRVGGDEFMVIQEEISDQVYQENVQQLQHFMKEKEVLLGFDFTTAFGSDVYRYEQNFGAFKHHVDQLMYRKKNERSVS